MVSERLARPSWGDALLEIWHADLPLFLSTDLLLHTVHLSYDVILRRLEETWLMDEVDEALGRMHQAWPTLQQRYGSTPGMATSLGDVDLYLTVARSLLAGTLLPAQGTADAADLYARCVEASGPAPVALFSETPRIYDFSQMRPRGHYTLTPALERWFRCMMWLGRTELRLTVPPGMNAPPDVDREIVDAFLLRELAAVSGGRVGLDRVDRVIGLLVGAPDNTTLAQLDALWTDLGVDGVDALLDPAVMATFETLLATGDYHPQAILSQILLGNPMQPQTLDPPYAFLPLGQRFVVDSYVTANVVYDRIEHDGLAVFRGLPDPLDVLYALGNDDVLPLLKDELEAYRYAPNLSALRWLIDSYPDSFWEESLYNAWLDALRSVAHSGRQPGAPSFMRTGAWQQEKMNTQLASWAELRHDNLLYAKQSYTGGVICSYPRVYLEPIPSCYASLERFCLRAEAIFAELTGEGPWIASRVADFYRRAAEIFDRLAGIAAKELDGVAFTEEEGTFLAQALYLSQTGCTIGEWGWLVELLFEAGDRPFSQPDLLVADVHTQPTDAMGNPVGRILHAGTGDPTLGLFVATRPGDGEATAFVGPVASFHAWITEGFHRLTDEEWAAVEERGRPDWTWVYLADVAGGFREGGRLLVAEPETPIEDPGGGTDDPPDPGRARVVRLRAAPNPFNPRTVLELELTAPAGTPVVVDVVDARGRHVRRLVRATAARSLWLIPWDGRDDAGRPAASGVYHARAQVGDHVASTKMSLIR
jgi:hypothetical protein